MALITPEVGQRSFETCDVATVDPNGNGSRVWLVNGDTITYANTTAAAMAALIVNDSAEPLMAGPIASATFGESIYICAQNVAQTRELAAVPPSSLVTMTGGPGPFVVTALVADLNGDLNATARCGGGGGGDSGYTEHNETQDLTILGLGDLNADSIVSTWVRSGNGNAAGPGDVVQVDVQFVMNSNAGDIAIGFTVGNLPGPIDFEVGVTISAENHYQITGTPVPALGFRQSGLSSNSVTFEGNTTTGGNAAWNVGLRFTYTIAGV